MDQTLPAKLPERVDDPAPEIARLALRSACIFTFVVYILGGFGGAAEVLASAMLATGNDRPS